MAKRRRPRKMRWDLNTHNRPSQTSVVENNKACGKVTTGDHARREPLKKGKLGSDHHKNRLNSDPGGSHRTIRGRSLPSSPSTQKVWKPATSSLSPSLRSLSDHKYDRVIRDALIHGSVLQQTLKSLIDSLTKIKSDPEEMEWEISNTTYLVPEQPPCMKDVSFAKISLQAAPRLLDCERKPRPMLYTLDTPAGGRPTKGDGGPNHTGIRMSVGMQ